MSLWYRVFGANDEQPTPAAILARLQEFAAGVRGDFTGDDAGWYAAVIHAGGAQLHLERFLVTEEGIRAELNSWAAWLETRGEDASAVRLMERVIQTRQLITIERPSDAALAESICLDLCRFLAAVTDGVYQADGQGFCDSDGTVLVREE
jgi:hypothetical protein